MIKKRTLKEILLTGSNPMTSAELYLALVEKEFRLKDANVNSRVFLHWKKNELIPNLKGEREWVRLDFYEYLWLQTINRMREFGCSLKLIKETKKVLFTKLNYNEVVFDKKTASKIDKKLDEAGVDEKIKKEVTDKFHQGQIEVLLKEVGFPTVMFHNMILAGIVNNQQVGILIIGKNEVIPWMDEFLNIDPKSFVFFQKSHIYISISSLIDEFLGIKSKLEQSPITILSEDENLILQAVRSKDFKKITIIPQKPEKGEKVKFDIITLKDGVLTKKEEEEISQILGMKNYQKISLTKSNGTQISFEREHRKRIT